MHFKHITHRRIGTYNRFPNRDPICRFCAQENESSVHLGTCPALDNVFDTIHYLTDLSPTDDLLHSTTAEKATKRLFMLPQSTASTSREILYLLAWRYILTDFYRIHYDNAKFNSDYVVRRMLERYITLCKAALYGNNTDASRRAKADMGRQPKKRMDVNDLRPLFETNDDNELVPSRKLVTVLERLNIQHTTQQQNFTGLSDQG